MNAQHGPWADGGRTPSWAKPYDTTPGAGAQQRPNPAAAAGWQYNAGQNPHGAKVPNYGAQMGPYGRPRAVQGRKNRTTAGILAILFGGFGAHKFYMEYPHAGVLMLLLTFLTGGVLGLAVQAVGIIEGIIYLTMPEERFQETYIRHEKKWF